MCVCVCVCQLVMSSSSLTDRSSMLSSLQKDLELKRSACDTLEENLQLEKVARCRFLIFICLFLWFFPRRCSNAIGWPTGATSGVQKVLP